MKLKYDELLTNFAFKFNLRRYTAGAQRERRHLPGRAVRVDPIKPTLKAPGIKLLKLKYDKPLSNFAFKFNLRRYILEALLDNSKVEDFALPFKCKRVLRPYQQEGVNWLAFLRRFKLHGALCDDMVGRCSFTLSNPS